MTPPTHNEPTKEAPRLTDGECDHLRRLPVSFNDMLRATFERGWDKGQSVLKNRLATLQSDQESLIRVGAEYASLIQDMTSQLAAQSAQIEALKQDLRIAHEGLDERDQLRDQIEAAKEAVADAVKFINAESESFRVAGYKPTHEVYRDKAKQISDRCAAAGIKTEK